MLEKTVLVTGASGQLGRRLVLALIQAGYRVTAHYRSKEKSEKLCPAGVEPVLGDLISPDWLMEATRGCDIVIHGAARVSMRPGNEALLHQVNVEGTRAVVEACLGSGVKRLIHVSTAVAVGASTDDTPLDEGTPAAWSNLAGSGIPYIETKREAELVALTANGSNLEVVVVNPSIMISPPDRQLTAKDLRKIPRWVPVYFDFGLNLVQTEDVVSGIVAAIEKGRAGQRYLLTGENVGPDKAFSLAKEYFGTKRPLIKIPTWTLYPVAFLFEVASRFRGKPPRFHRGMARLARLRFFYSNEKARRDLGFNPRPLTQTLEEILKSIRPV